MFKNVVFGLSVVAGMLFGGSVVSADSVSYTIQPGDTMQGISDKTGFRVQDIAELNNIDDVNVIYAGDVLTMTYRDVTDQDVAEYNEWQYEGVNPDDLDTATKRNDNGEVSDPDTAVAPVQNETVTQDAQVETPQQDTPAIAANDIVTINGVDDKGINFDDGDDSNDQYYVNSVNDWGYGHTEDNSDKTVSTPALTVPAPDQFVTPQHTTFNSTEAQPIAGDSSVDGSKVFNGSVWVLK